MQAPAPSTIALLVLLPLLAWRVYSRFRRMIGRQRLSRVRPWITLTIFPALVAVLVYAAQAHVERLGWMAGGLMIGSLLAVYGLRLTRFEPTPQGLYYTPSVHLGIALSLLFVGRIVYRLAEVYAIDATAVHSSADFVRSPATLALFGLLAGYYIGYAFGLVSWRNRVLRARRERESLPKDS
jgi:xanthosine utilization system XapX-like protein